jgi:hypothetical protein
MAPSAFLPLQTALQTTGSLFCAGTLYLLSGSIPASFLLSVPEYFFQRQFFYFTVFFQVIRTDFFL